MFSLCTHVFFPPTDQKHVGFISYSKFCLVLSLVCLRMPLNVQGVLHLSAGHGNQLSVTRKQKQAKELDGWICDFYKFHLIQSETSCRSPADGSCLKF